MGFPEQQLDTLVDAMPDMVGFSGYGGDGAVLELAMEDMPADQLELVLAVMEHGGKLQAAKKLVEGEASIIKTIEISGKIQAALSALRERFFLISEDFRY